MKLAPLNNHAGSSTLFVATFVLPVFFFLAGLSIDLTLYYLQKRNTQAFIDEAVVFAQRYLPYQGAAESSLRAFLERQSNLTAYLQTAVSADSISIEGLIPARLIFPRYFGLTQQVPYHVYARAQNRPADSLVLLDVGDYLSPDYPLGNTWGNPQDWPAASFFSNTIEILQDVDRDGTPEAIDAGLATQQCFNPVFSAIKQAAIETSWYLSGFSLNAVGVSVFPGNEPHVSDLSEIQVATPSGSPSRVVFAPYNSQYMRNSYCAAAASEEINVPGYQFPSPPGTLQGIWQPAPGAPAMVDPQSYDFNMEYQPFLTLAESIWSRAVRKGQVANTSDLLDTLRAKLIASAPIIQRAGLSHRATKHASIFYGDLPYQNGQRFPAPGTQQALSDQLLALAEDSHNSDQDVILHFIFVNHQNSAVNYANEVAQLKIFVDEVLHNSSSQPHNLQAHVIFAPGLVEFREQLLPVLARQIGSAVLVN